MPFEYPLPRWAVFPSVRMSTVFPRLLRRIKARAWCERCDEMASCQALTRDGSGAARSTFHTKLLLCSVVRYNAIEEPSTASSSFSCSSFVFRHSFPPLLAASCRAPPPRIYPPTYLATRRLPPCFCINPRNPPTTYFAAPSPNPRQWPRSGGRCGSFSWVSYSAPRLGPLDSSLQSPGGLESVQQWPTRKPQGKSSTALAISTAPSSSLATLLTSSIPPKLPRPVPG